MLTSLRRPTLARMNAASNATYRVAGLVACCLLQSLPVHAAEERNAPAVSAKTLANESPAGQAAATLPVPVSAPAPVVTYDIQEVQVEGNTVLPVPLIEQIMQPFNGPGKTLADLEKARAELERAYQASGFITVVVDLDGEAVRENVLKLVVIEGKVERVKVSGAQYVSPAYVREQVAELREGAVPNFNVVQQQLMGASKGDDRRVQPIVRPGRTPGTVETELQVSDHLPLSLNLELNNRQSPDTRPLRLNATLRYDNLFQKDHSLSLTAITAPQDTSQSKVGVISYTMPAASGASWAFYAVKSDSLVEPVGAATVVGKGSVKGVRYVLPLPGSNDLTQSLVFGVDYKHFRERIGTGPDSPTTPLVYMPFSLAYNANTQGEVGNDQFTGTLVMASRDLLRREVTCAGYDTPQDQFTCKNPKADGSFTTLRLDWRHTHALFGKWNGLIRLGGQLSSQPLVSNEQYALGGVDTVRGYFESEASGDKAVLSTLELQSPNWMAGKSLPWVQELTSQVFMDSGRVYTTDPAAGVPSHASLQSLGMGLKLRSGQTLSADMSVAWPFKAASTYTELHRPRLHARLALQF